MGAIGVDSGLSHMAVGLDLPHVQLYNFDTAWRTGPQSHASNGSIRQISVFAQPSPNVPQVVAAWNGVADAIGRQVVADKVAAVACAAHNTP